MRPVAGAAVTLMALALGGCGGNDDADGRARASCEAEARNAAQAAVIAEAFADGKLGTRAEVQAHFTPEDRLFDPQGRMIPYRRLEPLTRARFDSYRSSSAIPGEVQDELGDARQRVRESGYPDC